jgi:hypothetical protein
MTMPILRPRRAAPLVLFVTLPLLSSCCSNREWVCVLPGWEDGQNILQNGSFEEGGAFIANVGPQGVMSLPPNDETITAWKVLANPALKQDVAWVDKSNSFGIPAKDGARFVDLTGYKDTPVEGPFGGIRQSFPTTSGFDYVVRLSVGVFSLWPGPVTVTVMWDAAPPFTCPSVDAKDGVSWITCEHQFKATSAQTELTISGGSGTNYIGLDKVSVDCVAPLGRHDLCSSGSL